MLKDEVASQVIKEVNLNRVENALRKALKSVRDRSRNKDEGIPMQVFISKSYFYPWEEQM